MDNELNAQNGARAGEPETDNLAAAGACDMTGAETPPCDSAAKAAPASSGATPAAAGSSITANAKPKPVYTLNDCIFAAIALLLGFAFIEFIMSSNRLGASVFVFTILFSAFVLFYFRAKKIALTREGIICFLIAFLLGFFYILSDNFILKLITLPVFIVFITYTVITACGLRFKNRITNYITRDIISAFFAVPFCSFDALPQSLYHTFKKNKQTKNILLLALGLFCAIPVLLIVGGLLMNADEAFQNMLSGALSYLSENFGINLIKIIFSIPISFYIFGLIFGGVHRHLHDGEKIVKENKGLFPPVLFIGLITPVLLLYIVFFFSQTSYFLSGFSGLLPNGFNYSEYARRGFFELCNVSFINLILIILLNVLSKKTERKNSFVKIYTIILSLVSLTLIAISLSKMFLYIGMWGLTPLRLYTSWFMLFLIFVFVYILIYCAKPRFGIMRFAAVTAVCMFLVLCFSNTDYLIAKYNLESFKSGSVVPLDVSLLEELGPSATPVLIEILQDDSFTENQKSISANALMRKYNSSYNDEWQRDDWRDFTISKWRSDSLIKGNLDLVVKYTSVEPADSSR